MTEKHIKNEQWFINILISKINNNEIGKVFSYLRPLKWDIQPTKEKAPSMRRFIEFLYKTRNSVNAITFGCIDGNYSNIDGNNRINAICRFMSEPFIIFPEYLVEINDFIDNNFENIDTRHKLKSIFAFLDYSTVITFKYNKFFKENGETEFYNTQLKNKYDEFEDFFNNIQKKLSLNNGQRFDMGIMVNVNLFYNYTKDELRETYADINKYINKFTEMELLTCQLNNVVDFHISNNAINFEIENALKTHYLEISKHEILDCYQYKETDDMNAYQFMTGFQKYIHDLCPLIEDPNSKKDTLSLFFKIYKTMYNDLEHTFTDENVNNFTDKIIKAAKILSGVSNHIGIENISDGSKVFDACNKKMKSLVTNNLYILIIAIIGYINNGETDLKIFKSIEKSLLFHFLTQDLPKTDKDAYKICDIFTYSPGGSVVNNLVDQIYKDPNMISDKITREKMDGIIETLIHENIKAKSFEVRPNGKNQNDKRRFRKFFEEMLMCYFYRTKVSVELLNRTFWVEHICPFSSSWDNQIDIDRLGNIIPIVDKLNSKRSTKHISDYKNYDNVHFIDFIKEIIPSDDIYDKIITHEARKPRIINTDEFDILCNQNEMVYKNNFIKCLF